MRTEYELHAAIDELAQDSPDVDALLRSVGTPPRHRARLIAPIAVAAAVILVAGGIAIATSNRASTTAAGPAEHLASAAHPCATYGQPGLRTFSIGHVDGLADQQQAREIVSGCSGYTSRTVYAANGREIGQVTVYRAGVFDASKLAAAHAVHGDGIDGLEIPPKTTSFRESSNSPVGVEVGCPAVVSAAPTQPNVRAAHACATPATLAWEYAPDAWATVASGNSGLATAKQLQLAAAVDTAHTVPMRLPFAFGALPTDVRIMNVYSDVSRSGEPVAVTVGFGLTGRPGCPRDAVCDQVGEVSLGPQHGTPSHQGEAVSINGYLAHLIDQGEVRPDIPLTYQTGIWNVFVGDGSDRQLPDSDLIDIARGLRYAPSTADRSTWFRAD